MMAMELHVLSVGSVMFVNVGQGNFTIVCGSKEDVWFFDMGCSKKPDNALRFTNPQNPSRITKTIVQILKEFKRIHVVFSHPDQDHTNLFPSFIQKVVQANLPIKIRIYFDKRYQLLDYGRAFASINYEKLGIEFYNTSEDEYFSWNGNKQTNLTHANSSKNLKESDEEIENQDQISDTFTSKKIKNNQILSDPEEEKIFEIQYHKSDSLTEKKNQEEEEQNFEQEENLQDQKSDIVTEKDIQKEENPVDQNPIDFNPDGVRLFTNSKHNLSVDKNTNSIIAKIKMGKYYLYIPGDATEETFDALPANFFDSFSSKSLLLVSHHGAGTHGSTKEDLLKKIKPDICIISAHLTSSYNHPASSIVDLLAKWYSEHKTTTLEHLIYYHKFYLPSSLLSEPPSDFYPLITLKKNNRGLSILCKTTFPIYTTGSSGSILLNTKNEQVNFFNLDEVNRLKSIFKEVKSQTTLIQDFIKNLNIGEEECRFVCYSRENISLSHVRVIQSLKNLMILKTKNIENNGKATSLEEIIDLFPKLLRALTSDEIKNKNLTLTDIFTTNLKARGSKNEHFNSNTGIIYNDSDHSSSGHSIIHLDDEPDDESDEKLKDEASNDTESKKEITKKKTKTRGKKKKTQK